jgi:hypothetical protein
MSSLNKTQKPESITPNSDDKNKKGTSNTSTPKVNPKKMDTPKKLNTNRDENSQMPKPLELEKLKDKKQRESSSSPTNLSNREEEVEIQETNTQNKEDEEDNPSGLTLSDLIAGPESSVTIKVLYDSYDKSLSIKDTSRDFDEAIRKIADRKRKNKLHLMIL